MLFILLLWLKSLALCLRAEAACVFFTTFSGGVVAACIENPPYCEFFNPVVPAVNPRPEADYFVSDIIYGPKLS